MANKLAFFKSCPSKTIPHRLGPIQCIRTCTRCVANPVLDEDLEAENILAVMSYRDLVNRKILSLADYQTIQYHLGQIVLLKRSMRLLKPSLVIYVVAVSDTRDLIYLTKVLDKESLPLPGVINGQLESSQKGSLTIPIEIRCCPANEGKESEILFNVRQLRDTLQPIVDKLKTTTSDQVLLAPVSITKDCGSELSTIGSLCVQILEPYPLIDVVFTLKTEHKTGHIVQHIYYDLSMNGVKMSTQIVAFLLLYLDRPAGITKQDLTEYMSWFRTSAMDLNLHIGFTGLTEDAVCFGLLGLSDHIHVNQTSGLVTVVNLRALTEYASIMVPNIAYYGVISRAILMLHNSDAKNEMRTNLGPENQIKVMKDDLLEISQELAEIIDLKVACRPPCKDVQTCILDVFTRMQTCGKYFRIQEARIRQSAGRAWAGDYDSDEEYFETRRNDPAFKPWVILTQRPYRLDRLNLFMNAIEPYLWTEQSCDNMSSPDLI